MANRTIGILGLGIFGQSVLKTLQDQDVDIIAIKPQLARCSGQDEHHMEFLPLNTNKRVYPDCLDDFLFQKR